MPRSVISKWVDRKLFLRPTEIDKLLPGTKRARADTGKAGSMQVSSCRITVFQSLLKKLSKTPRPLCRGDRPA